MKRSHLLLAGLGLVVLVSVMAIFLFPPGNRQTENRGQPADPGYPSLEVYLTVLNGDEASAANALQLIDSQWKPGSASMLMEMLPWLTNKPVGGRIRQILLNHLNLNNWFPNQVLESIWAIDHEPHPDYGEFKKQLLSLLDPRFGDHFGNDVPHTIRLDQIQWGGVYRDGIPPLREPEMIGADEADYLEDDNVVFGIIINGDARAYPKRILAWHEMFRDSIGDVPVAGVYCTLCGTVVVYERTLNGVTHDLGTSGMLYQSNKLMYDADTDSLWSTMTGQPVVGPLVGQGIVLHRRPVVTTTWGQWKQRHPETTVLSLNTGHQRDYSEGAAYEWYFRHDDLMFPVPKMDRRLNNKDEVLALRDDAGETTLAIYAGFLLENPVYHDRLGEQPIVVFTSPDGANRVFDCQEVVFRTWDGQSTAVDDQGGAWTVEEDQLSGPEQRILARLPAHRSFWFGWFAAFPETRLVK